MTGFARDLRQAARLLLKDKTVTVVAVVTLALGLSANFAIYALIDSVLFQPLSVQEADRLVVVARHNPRSEFASRISWPDYEDYRDQVPGLRETVALAYQAVNVSWSGQRPSRTYVQAVSANYFRALGASPAVGRLFVRGEGTTKGADPIFVLSHRYWRDRLGSDAGVVGQSLRINGQSYEVVGVAAEGFDGAQFGVAPAGWLPATMIPSLFPAWVAVLETREAPLFRVLAYLSDGHTTEQVEAALAIVDQRLAADHPAGAFDGVVTRVIPEQRSRPDPSMSDYIPLAASIFLGLSVLVLVVACANVANLLSARAVSRQREWAIRSAIGASRARLARQQLTESMLLALVAGLVALGLMSLLGPAIRAIAPPTEVPTPDRALSGLALIRFAGVTVGVSLLTGLVTGLVPAIRATSGGVQQLSEGRAGRWLRGALVGSQVGFCVVVLVAGGLFVRALGRAADIPFGFASDGIALASLDLGLQGYAPGQAIQFLDDLRDELGGLPRVTSVSMATSVPLGPRPELLMISDANAARLGESGRTEGEIEATRNRVDDAYLETMDVKLLQGRGFTRLDVPGAPPVAIVNTTLAESLWPGADPVGRRLRTAWLPVEQSVEVVGVIQSGKYLILTEAPRPHLLLPLAQSYWGYSPVTVHLRTTGDPAAVLGDVRRVLGILGPELPIYDAMTIEEHLRTSIFGLMPLRAGSRIAGAQGMAGLLLALAGISSVVAYTVSTRTREIGIRRALGATQMQVVRFVTFGVLRSGTVGLGFGLVLAVSLSQLLHGLLPGMEGLDLPVFVYTALLLTTVCALAGGLPALRATKIDAAIAMRGDK